MMMKSFIEDWGQEEISVYIKTYDVLVLFKAPDSNDKGATASIKIFSTMIQKYEDQLLLNILQEFGGKNLSEDIAIAINEYAESWYDTNMKSIRVFNIRRK